MFNNTIQFIKQNFKNNDSIFLHEPTFNGNEKKYLEECIDSTYVSSVGPFVDNFEKSISKYIRTNKSVAVVNATAGLHMALKIVGVDKDDEVLTQSLTFVATVNAIAYNNAIPVFIDVDFDTMGLSAKSVSNFLEEFGELRDDGCYNKKTNRKISACLPMHTFGFPVKIDDLINVCNEWKIPIVEDAAESLGSLYKGKPTGSFGDVGVFSFNGNKIITSGGGGIITSNNLEFANKAKFLTTTAKTPHPFEYKHEELGYNYRMPNLNAALALAQLEQLDFFINYKRKLAKEYKNFFKNEGIKFRTETENTKANYWLMCVELNDKREKDLFLKSTNKSGVMTRPVWELMINLPMYKSCQKDNQKNSLLLRDRIVNIPSSVCLK